MRGVLIGAVALGLLAGGAAQAQGVSDVAGFFAAAEEQLGQSVGEAALSGSSVFVTAKGTAGIAAAAAKPYSVTAQADGPTVAEAAKARDAILDRLRAVAKRYGVQMTLEESNYLRGFAQPAPSAPRSPATPAPAAAGGPPPPPVVIRPVAAPGNRPFQASTVVQFSRPADAMMPAFLDAVHDAGVDNLGATNPQPTNPLAAAAAIFGSEPGPGVDQAVWDKAGAAAVTAARAQAEVLAAAAGRHVGPVRSIMLISRFAQGDEATVTVAARFGFAP